MRRLIALPLVVAAALVAVPVAHASSVKSPLPMCFATQEFGRFCIG
jgi:hypothetical protein